MPKLPQNDLILELEELWPGSLPVEERVNFIAWELDRRKMALTRLRAILAYQGGEATPVTLMERLQIGSSQFYKLVRDWNANQSLAYLVPHARKRSSKIRTHSAVTTLIRAKLAEYAGSDHISENKLIGLIRTEAEVQGLKAPAPSTVRQLIARMSMEDPYLPQARKESTDQVDGFSNVFGGQILVDHSTLDLLCLSENLLIRPTISMVVDNSTKIILAIKLSDNLPQPDDAIAVIAAANVGYADIRQMGMSAIPGLHPVLTMRSGTSVEWAHLRDLARQARFKFDIRRAPDPVFGHVLRRSMITRIGRHQLLPRYTMREPHARVRDNEKDSKVELTLSDVQTLIELAVKVHNRERLKVVPAATVLGAAKLRLNTERQDWLQFGLAVFKDSFETKNY
jgi:hypothetical protein